MSISAKNNSCSAKTERRTATTPVKKMAKIAAITMLGMGFIQRPDWQTDGVLARHGV
jgi:hypothetical protein